MTGYKTNTWAACLAVGLALAVATPAVAQDSTTGTRQNSSSPSGSLEQYHGAFRASEIVGATVYNDQGNSVGKVNDVLLDTSGKADKVVISGGGVLGIDSKYVDVGFDQLKIEANHHANSDTTSNTSMAVNNSGMSTTTGAPRSASTTTANTPSSMTSGTESNRYYSLVMPGATKESLSKMPEFKYSS